MTISLPREPTGEQYEDLVAACLKVLGYFTETRVVLRENKKEVLELDVVATPVGKTSQNRQLFEAKKDAANFPSVFKLYGQRMYLGIENACLVSLRSCDRGYADAYEKVGGEIGVRLCHMPLDSGEVDDVAPFCNTLSRDLAGKAMQIAWYQQIGRRVAQASFVQECVSNRGSRLIEEARSYIMEVQQSFFQKTALDRAEALYSAYWASPNLVGQFVTQIASAEGISEQQIWGRLNDSGELLWLQYLMLVENTARICIIKNALDDVIERGGPPPTVEVQFGDSTLHMPRHDLPPRFKKGLETMRGHQHALRLPYLFQVFVELLGGFLLLDNQTELQFVEDATGIPKSDILPSLAILDNFFAPPDGGTCFYKQKERLFCMKMIPGFVHGGGSFMRKVLLGIVDHYEEHVPVMGWLLGMWHNSLYSTLQPVLTAQIGGTQNQS